MHEHTGCNYSDPRVDPLPPVADVRANLAVIRSILRGSRA